MSVQPYSSREVSILYTPRSLGKSERGSIALTNDVCGSWTYNLVGEGLRPVGVAGSIQVSAPMGGSASELFVFRNPFLFPLRLQVRPLLAYHRISSTAASPSECTMLGLSTIAWLTMRPEYIASSPGFCRSALFPIHLHSQGMIRQ